MKEKEYNFTINEQRREVLANRPDYCLTNAAGLELSLLFEREAGMYLVFAKERDTGGREKEWGGGLATSYENAIRAIFGNRYLPFYALQIPSESFK